jgi:hypothetical protein
MRGTDNAGHTKERMFRVKFQYNLKSLIFVLLLASIGMAIATPFVRNVLLLMDGYELVGVGPGRVHWILLLPILAVVVLAVAFVIQRGPKSPTE